VVAGCDALSVPQILIESASGRHIREGAVAVVMIERAVRPGRAALRGRGSGLHENDIREAVIIIIHEGAAGRGVFDEVKVSRGSAGMGEPDAGSLGDILEKDVRARRNGWM